MPFDVGERRQRSAKTRRRRALCTQPRCRDRTRARRQEIPSTHRWWQENKTHSCSSVRGIRCNVARCYTLNPAVKPGRHLFCLRKHSWLSPSSATGRFPKMSEKITYVQPWQLNVPRGFSKSLSYCASVEDLYICAADLSGRVLEGVVTFLLHLLEGGQSGRGRGKKFCKYISSLFSFFFL